MEKKTLINNSLERKLGACLYEEFYIHIYIYHIDEWKSIGFSKNFFVSLES